MGHKDASYTRVDTVNLGLAVRRWALPILCAILDTSASVSRQRGVSSPTNTPSQVASPLSVLFFPAKSIFELFYLVRTFGQMIEVRMDDVVSFVVDVTLRFRALWSVRLCGASAET